MCFLPSIFELLPQTRQTLFLSLIDFAASTWQHCPANVDCQIMSIKTLTKSDIADVVYEKSGKSRHEAARLVNALLSVMCKSIHADGSLLFSGFGKFEINAKKQPQDEILKPANPSPCPPTSKSFSARQRFLRMNSMPEAFVCSASADAPRSNGVLRPKPL